MKIKSTLNMPQTSFSMKAGLSTNEPKWQETWYENDYYHKRLSMNEGKTPFYLHDGPPYANGSIHTGHALNKVIKDIIIRSKNMNGYYAPITFGWDTHGLPIENAMLKKMKKNADDFDTAKLREECEKYALEQVRIQKEQFFQLGLMADPNDDYLTLYHEFEQGQIEVFNGMVKRGLIYQGLKPVYWSWSSKSALADAEIEYKDVKSPAIYVGFDLVSDSNKNTQVVIWTTTPWTIPANEGISVGPDFDYDVIKVGNKNYVIAHELVASFVEQVGIDEYQTITTFKGSELENQKVLHPITNEEKIIMLGDHVTVESGTGCVHTAPGHGEDDFLVGKKYNIPVTCVVDEKGVMTSEAGQFAGLFYDDANKEVTQVLEASGHLINLSFITHSYPHDWRTKKPVFYRATKQWFCNIEPIKQDLLDNINKTEFVSDWGRVRLYNMLDNRSEWCISRQRKWGVPIPIFYAEDDTPIVDPEIIEHVGNLFLEYGSNIWFEKEASELLPKGYTNEHSPNNIFRKEMDIMDVWFDSGSSHVSVMEKRYGVRQSDLYMEGSDQYRGWFNSSLITSVAYKGIAPYKTLLSHGFVMDGKGNKMSKSLGNTIEPAQIINQRGRDILRMWVSSVNYQQDVNLTEELLDQVGESYRKIRNTIRFMLGNVSDFNESMVIDFNDLEQVDQFMLINLDALTKEIVNSYEQFNFVNVLEVVMNYITRLLSGFYLDFIKDVIYVSSADAKRRRQVQTVLYYHLEQLLTLLSPIIPHTTYEAYLAFKDEVVFFKDFQLHDEWQDYQLGDMSLVEVYTNFLTIREAINKELDVLRKQEVMDENTGKMVKVIGSSLKADVVYTPSNDTFKQVIDIVNQPQVLCIVHAIKVNDVDANATNHKCGNVEIIPLTDPQCDRCRQCVSQDDLSVVVEEDGNQAHVCPTCLEIINNWSENV